MRKKQLLKRFSAVALAISLAVPTSFLWTVPVEAVEAAETSMITNGDFEGAEGVIDATGWSIGKAQAETTLVPEGNIVVSGEFEDAKADGSPNQWNKNSVSNGTIEVVEDDDTAGNHVLRLTFDGTQGQSTIVGTNYLSAAANTKYIITYKLKIDDNNNGNAERNALIHPFIVEKNSSGEATYTGKINDTIHYTTKDNGWETVKLTYTTGEAGASLLLRFVMSEYKGTAYIDDVAIATSMKEEPLTSTTTNYYGTNGDFEDTSEGEDGVTWKILGGVTTATASYIEDAEDTENHLLKIEYAPTEANKSPVNVGNGEYIPVEYGKTYHVSYDMKCEETAFRAAAAISERYGDAADNPKGEVKNYLIDTYQVAGGNSKTVEFDYTIQNGDTEYICFRFMVYNGTGTAYIDNLTITSEETEVVYGDGVIAYGDGHALKLSNGASTVYTDATLEDDTWYKYTYDVELGKNNAADFTYGVEGSEVISDNDGKSGVFKACGTQFKLVTTGTGTVYFDNITLCEADETEIPEAGNDTLIRNGDFERSTGEIDITGWPIGAAKAKTTLVPEGNIIENGEFENDSEGSSPSRWNKVEAGNGTIAVAVDDESTGNHVLKLTFDGTDGKSTIVGSNYLTAAANTQYTISYKLKIDDNNNGNAERNAQISTWIIEKNSSKEVTYQGKIDDTVHYTTKDNGWETVTQTYTTGEAGASLCLRFAMSQYEGTAYIDDVAIATSMKEEPVTNTITVFHGTNGDFEDMTEGVEGVSWKVLGGVTTTTASYVEDTENTANHLLKIEYAPTEANKSPVYVGNGEYIPVEYGKTYHISYDMKCEEEGFRACPAISERYGDEAANPKGQIKNYELTVDYQVPGGTSKKVEFDYTIQNEGTGYICFRFMSYNASGVAYIDNLVITSEETEVVYSDGIMARGEGYVLKLSNGNTAEYTGATLETGTWYKYTYDIETGKGNAEDFTYGVAGEKAVVAEDGKSGVFKATGTTFKLVTTGTGTVYFDNITLKPAGDDEIPSEGCEHVNKETIPAVAATCTTAGKTAGVKCKDCGTIITAQETIAIDKTNHVNKTTIPAVAATCTTAGKTAGVKCKDCGTIITAQKTAAKLGHNYQNVTTPATTSTDGKVQKICTRCKGVAKTTTIKKASKITVSNLVYSGSTQNAKIVVKDRSGNKISSNYYTVSGSTKVKKVGQYAVTIKFKGNYSGTIKKMFKVNPKAVKLSKVKASSKKLTVTWGKYTQNVTGYQIQYSLKKNLSGAKTVTVKKNTTTKTVIKNLKAKKKYYVRVRTYYTKSGKTYYSAWSSSKNATTKK